MIAEWSHVKVDPVNWPDISIDSSTIINNIYRVNRKSIHKATQQFVSTKYIYEVGLKRIRKRILRRMPNLIIRFNAKSCEPRSVKQSKTAILQNINLVFPIEDFA